jgi:hypothetical protein
MVEVVIALVILKYKPSWLIHVIVSLIVALPINFCIKILLQELIFGELHKKIIVITSLIIVGLIAYTSINKEDTCGLLGK